MANCMRCNTKDTKVDKKGRCVTCGALIPTVETHPTDVPKEPDNSVPKEPKPSKTIKFGSDLFGDGFSIPKPPGSAAKPTVKTTVKIEKEREKSEYIIFGQKFLEGAENECLMFLLKSFQINYIFKDRVSKAYSDKFLLLVKNYYSQNDSKVDALINEFRSKLASYSREEIFYMTFIYLFNFKTCIIKKQGQVPIEFNSPIECAEFLAKDITTRSDILNKYRNVILYYLQCNDDIYQLSECIYSLTGKVTYVGVNYGQINLISFGTKNEFIDSLVSPKYMDEKRALIKDIFKYNDSISLGTVDKNVLEYFNIHQSQVETFMFNIKYAATVKTILTFNPKHIFSNDEQEFVRLMLNVKKTENIDFENFIIAMFYMIKNGVFDDTNFENIINYKVEGETIKQLSKRITSINTLKQLAVKISSNVVDREFNFCGVYLSIDKIVDKMEQLSNQDLIRSVKLFNQNELDNFLISYGVKVTKKEIEKIIGELL